MRLDYVVKITDQAKHQLTDILVYISEELHAPKSSKKLLDIIESELEKLSFFPKRHSLVNETPWKQEGIRKVIIKNFITYYWIDESENIVHILAFVYSKRDQVKLLNKL